MKVAVTGANGFVGHALCEYLNARGITPRPLTRQAQLIAGHQSYVIPSPLCSHSFAVVLKGCTSLIHLAARTHQSSATPYDDLANFRAENVILSQNIAEAAARAGIRRFIFISSIKVYGNGSDEPYSTHSPTQPADAYGQTKLEAENALKAICSKTNMELVIIRAPLIFSPHAKGNIATLLKAIRYKLPLPLASVRNKRDVLSLANLCELITLCLNHPKATEREWLACDGKALTTAEIIHLLASAHKLRAILLPLPVAYLNFMAKITGKEHTLSKLCGNLEVDSRDTQEVLGWHPLSTQEIIQSQQR